MFSLEYRKNFWINNNFCYFEWNDKCFSYIILWYNHSYIYSCLSLFVSTVSLCFDKVVFVHRDSQGLTKRENERRSEQRELASGLIFLVVMSQLFKCLLTHSRAQIASFPSEHESWSFIARPPPPYQSQRSAGFMGFNLIVRQQWCCMSNFGQCFS